MKQKATATTVHLHCVIAGSAWTRSPDRAAIQAKLRTAGIATGIHYPMPVHTQPAYKGRIALGPAACRASEQASAEVFSLPMFPELADDQVAQVCQALRNL